MRNFKYQSALLSAVRRCVKNYDMINSGDRIAVGASGGKDSTALLCALGAMRAFYPQKYSVVAVTVDCGFDGMDYSPLTGLCASLDIEHHIIKTEISKIVFDARAESNPCSLCSRMRRGALHNEAEKLGCTKVALGHNRDDVSQTLLMNLFYAGKLGVFWPVNLPDEKNISLIRPLIYASEKTVREFCRRNSLPIIKNTCPEDKHTRRETVKNLIKAVERENKGVSYRIFRAIEKSEIDGFRDFGGKSERQPEN